MKINVSGKNFTVTNALKEYTEKKVGKLDKYFENDVEAQATLVWKGIDILLKLRCLLMV